MTDWPIARWTLHQRDGLVAPARRAEAFGYVFVWGIDIETREQVLYRDDVEFCRRPGWESGYPCVFSPKFDEIAGNRERTLKLMQALCE